VENEALKREIDAGKEIYKMPFLKVYNVNHGDAMLFQADCVFKSTPLLIDTGESVQNIFKKINNFSFDIMITHQDDDHIGGLSDLLKYKLSDIQNIYLPLYQPEINKIFSKLREIGKKNATLIHSTDDLMHQYMVKIIFLYDGWHNNRKKYHCNLAKCSHSKILNPPIRNFDFLKDDPEFSVFKFEQAMRFINEKEIFDNFNPVEYTPENFNDQNEELIEARKQYFRYVIRLIGYTISKGQWISNSANDLFKLLSNDSSIVFHYAVEGRFSILFTGDAGDKILNKLISQGKLGQIDILKVPHHGGANSIGRKILDTIKPKYTILSHGNKQFGKGIVPNKKSILELQSRPHIRTLATNAVTGSSPRIGKTSGLFSINSTDSIEFL
jgi:beta-lactamase superfamily II metal-dependent hydrolase